MLLLGIVVIVENKEGEYMLAFFCTVDCEGFHLIFDQIRSGDLPKSWAKKGVT